MMKIVPIIALTITMLSVVANTQKQQTANDVPACSTGADHRQIEPQGMTLQSGQIPDYPSLARQARITGTVRLHVGIKDGVVTCAEVGKTDAAPILGNAAKRNVQSWRFVSGTGYFNVVYVFELKGEETTLPEIAHIEMDIPQSVRISAKPTKHSCQDCSPK